MTYRIAGLDPTPFAPLFAMSDAELAAQPARRVIAVADHGFPCRVSLEDARQGEELILLHHVSHPVDTPFRSAYAIFVRRGAARAEYIDTPPPVFGPRILSLRAVAAGGMVIAARLAQPGEADAAIRDLFAAPEADYILAFNAVAGCFSARIDRHQEAA